MGAGAPPYWGASSTHEQGRVHAPYPSEPWFRSQGQVHSESAGAPYGQSSKTVALLKDTRGHGLSKATQLPKDAIATAFKHMMQDVKSPHLQLKYFCSAA